MQSDLGPPNQELCDAAPAPPTPPPTPPPTDMPIVFSMSMSMDMGSSLSWAEEDISIKDYLQESTDVQGTISSEFGRKRNRVRSGLGNRPTRKNRHLKNRNLALPQSLPISGGSPVDKNDDAVIIPDDEILTMTQNDVECDDYPCTGSPKYDKSAKKGKDSKSEKYGKSKLEKDGKSKKADFETKKDDKESKKDLNKLKKSEKSGKSGKSEKSEKKRLRV